MFKIRSIAVRLILAISLTVAAACGILGTFSIAQQRALTRLALDQQLKLQYDSVIAALDYEGRGARGGGALVTALPPFQDAIVRSDRDAILTLRGRAQESLKAVGVPFLNLHLPPAVA